jgi:predicted metal-dependent hydrolase
MTAIHEVLQLPRGPTPVQWRRSSRARRISLRIDPRNSSVVVTLPARAARAAGMALLTDHAGWVADRLAALPAALAFTDGAMVPLDGTPHRIRHVPAGRGGAWLEAGEIHVAGDPAFLSRRVQDYVVAHEVAHLRHMNHGPRFWSLVAELTEHRERAVAWLALYGAGLLRAG